MICTVLYCVNNDHVKMVIKLSLVSFGILLSHFAHFHTMEYVSVSYSFFIYDIIVSIKAPMETESYNSMGWTILLLVLFAIGLRYCS